MYVLPAICLLTYLYFYTYQADTIMIPTALTKGVTKEGGADLCDYLINKQLPLAGLSRIALTRRLGVSPNSVYLWQKAKRVPLARAVQIAKILGIDPIFVRNWALKEWAPDLFQEDERLRKFADLTSNETEFLEIIRASGKVNPKMNDEQRKKFAEFVASLSDDAPANYYDDCVTPGHPNPKAK